MCSSDLAAVFATAGCAGAETAAPVEGAPAAEAAATAESPAVAEASAASEPAATTNYAVIESSQEPVRTSPLKGGPMRRLMEGLALTAAQLVDLPFRWVSEDNKDILGVIALLVLLGGVVLHVVARIAGR